MSYFLVFIIPSFLAALFLFLVLGALGLCGMNNCIGPSLGRTMDILTGAAFIVVAALPLVITSSVLYRGFRGRPLGKWIERLSWGAVLTIAGLGIFQVLVNPGDASWAGLPMLIFAGCFALSILNYPDAENRPSEKED